ncbi:MAG: YfhO family protein, partial [Oscillospiraceae bacterium]|nr:YfhO family protein [Oscillospiraceae bacterium]
VMCLITSKVIDSPDTHPIKSSYVAVAVIFAAYAVYMLMTFSRLDKQLAVAQFASTAVMYIMLAIVVFKLKHDGQYALNCISFATVGAIILSCSFVWSSLSLEMHRELIVNNYKPQTMDKYRSGNFERVELIDAYSNYNMFWHLPSSKSYISLCSNSIAELYEVLGEEYTVGGSYDSSAYPLRGLLSIKYVIDDVMPTDIVLSDKTGELTGMPGFCYDGTAGDFHVYENQYFVPMGFTYDRYCTYEDLKTINGSELRSMLLLEAVLLTDEQAEAYAGNMHRYDISELEYSPDRYYELCKERAAQSCDRFEASSDGFSAHITLDEHKLVFFSVPYDDGFTAYVNGAKVDIEKVSGGLMAIPCQAGDNEIEVVYRSQSFVTGLAISASGFVLYVLYLALCTKKKKQQ